MDYSPKLAADGSNWGIYRARMVWRLRVRSLADHLTNAEVPESGTEADTVDSDEAEDAIRWERDDETVKRYIAASIPDDVFKQIKGLGYLSAKAIWQNLTTQFERKSWRIRVQLWTRFHNQKCRSNDDVRVHFARMASLRNQLADAGVSISEEDYAYHLLVSLPKEYDENVSIIETTAFILEKELDPGVVTREITNQYERNVSRGLIPKTSKRRNRHRSQRGRGEGQCSTRANGEGSEGEPEFCY